MVVTEALGPRAPRHRHRCRRAARGAGSRRRRQPAGLLVPPGDPWGLAWRCAPGSRPRPARSAAAGGARAAYHPVALVGHLGTDLARARGGGGMSHLVDARAAAGRRRDRCVPGPPARHGSVRRRVPAGRRVVAGGCGRDRRADDRVLRLAVAPGRPWPRHRAADAHRGRVLPVAVPQHGAARGVLGDVHRGVQHGRGVGDVGRALRAVVWERSAGQVVQARARPRRAAPGAVVRAAGRAARGSRSGSCRAGRRGVAAAAAKEALPWGPAPCARQRPTSARA